MRKMWGLTCKLNLEGVKAFYKATFLTEIDPPKKGDDGGKLLWNHSTLGKVRKLSIQVLADEERCRSADCGRTAWTRPEGSESVVWFSNDGPGIAARYISDIAKFRDGR